jgi:hypothetical protein
VSPSPHLSSLTLDALALGALSAAEEAAARAHLAACPTCAGQLEAARAAGEEFARSVLPRTLPRVRERLARPAWTRSWRAFTLLPVSALAAAAVLLVVLRGGAPAVHPVEGGDLAVKGGATLRVFADHEGHVFQVRERDRLAPGDRIRFVVEPAGLPYLLVGSVDGTGAASIYYPYDAHASGRLAPAITIELPGSIVLDAAPGPERLFALFSREPLDAQVVRAALAELGQRGPDAVRAAHALSTPAAAQASLFFEKVVP